MKGSKRSRVPGSVSRAQRASWDGGKGTETRAQVSEGAIVGAQVTESVIVEAHDTEGTVLKAHMKRGYVVSRE